ncbi:MAG TPA: protein prkA [Acidimicrobiia bacterium]|nr:protein prkA [Acidimicrobiia bacterium]
MEPAQLLASIEQEAQTLRREITFEEYLQRVRTEPRLARLSHALIYDMIREAGIRSDGLGGVTYRLFEGHLFGSNEVIRRVVDYFEAAAAGMEVRKRILLLLGPPGSGKSTLVNRIKEGLESYTRTDEGEIYAIKECPVQEEPLHLIPSHRRAELEGLDVEGELCPHCRWLVDAVYDGAPSRVPIQRLAFSITGGVGFGTYVATDPRSEDLRRLVGEVDLTLLEGSYKGAAKRAFRLDGELNAANRGLADLIELFKMDERFLSVLLTLSQEEVIKLSGPGIMYADEALVAHSNLAEYDAMVDDPKTAALQDRLVVIKVPYVLSVRDEVAIYQKLVPQTNLTQAHVSPLSLPTAATLAILTRLEPPRRHGWDLQKKLRLYDGRYVAQARPEDLEELRSEAPGEGLSGVSPRYTINRLSQAVTRQSQTECISGLSVLQTMWEGLDQRAGFREEDRETWAELFGVARAEYDHMVRGTVRRAMVVSYNARANEVARQARVELDRWMEGAPETELETQRRIERALSCPQYLRTQLRTQIRTALASAEEEQLHRADPQLEEAIERLLLPSWREATLTVTDLGEETRSDLQARLTAEQGFCALCAEDLLDHASQLTQPPLRRRATRVVEWLTT